MVDELVDLCNSSSDNDDVVALPARNNSNNSIQNDDDSSSSSSSEDSYLWKVDVPKGSPPKEDVRRGNYFKEIRKKYKDDDDNSKRKHTKRHKIFHAVGSSNAEGDGEDFDVNNLQRNNDYDKSGSNMKSSSPPLVSDIGKQSSLSKQSSMTKQQLSLKNMSQDSNKEVECIEIDSSSDDYDTSGIKRTAKIATKMDHIPCKNNNSPMKKKSYDCSSNDDDSIYSTKLCREKKKSIDMTKCDEATSNGVSGNACTLEHSNYSSQSTDSTVSLPNEMLSPEMREYKKLSIQEKKKKFVASLHNTDDIEHVNDDLRGMDNGFDSFGRFDEDDDQLMRKKGNNKSQSSNKMESKSKAKPKSSMNGEIELLDNSSENSVNSESSAELFTPRFKKQATKPAALNPETYATTANSSESGLSTPRAFSPATTSPTMGAYATKRKVPTPAIPAMPAALVREIGGK